MPIFPMYHRTLKLRALRVLQAFTSIADALVVILSLGSLGAVFELKLARMHMAAAIQATKERRTL